MEGWQCDCRREALIRYQFHQRRKLLRIEILGVSCGNDYSRYCWSYFLNRKSDLKVKLVELTSELKDLKKTVELLRLDNTGEKFSFEKAYKQLQLGVTFEFSGPKTPQRNRKVERKFQTIYGKIRAMVNVFGIDDAIRNGLWAECEK